MIIYTKFGLKIFIHINENKHINKQYITMVYDGIQKEAIRLIRICFPKFVELEFPMLHVEFQYHMKSGSGEFFLPYIGVAAILVK